ncbi:MAG TPA: hypothetical protein VJR29_03990 [bacterium]|nr:hypothetical protein [bacterium]
MGKFIFVGVFFSLMTFFLASSPAAKGESELGSFNILLCHGENLPAEDLAEEDVYPPDQLALGAYNTWCYNAGGDKVAMIHHDAPLPALFGQSNGFWVSFTHYNDRNGDGKLEAREADGYLRMFAAVTPGLFKRVGISEDFTQGVIASEANPGDEPGITEATGWFKGTTQFLNRNNVHFIPTFVEVEGKPVLIGASMDFVNFGVMSFAKTPVQIVQ